MMIDVTEEEIATLRRLLGKCEAAPAQAPVGAVGAEATRAAFESRYQSDLDVGRERSGEYRNSETRNLWSAWKAGLAAAEAVADAPSAPGPKRVRYVGTFSPELHGLEGIVVDDHRLLPVVRFDNGHEQACASMMLKDI